jgi:hypothetical protein
LTLAPRGMRLEVRGGPPLRLRGRRVDARFTAVATDLAKRVAAARARPPSRQARPTTAEDIARLAAGSTDYREGSLSSDDLWGLLAAPTTDLRVRVAAATVLGESSDDVGRARLEATMNQCVDPELHGQWREKRHQN